MGNGVLATDYAGSGNIASVGSLSGNADGDKGIASVWFLPTNVNTFIYEGSFFSGPSNFGHGLRILNTNLVQMQLTSVIIGIHLRVRTTTPVVMGTWNHFLASWDITAGLQHLYLNDNEDLGSVFNFPGTLDYTRTTHTIGGGVAVFPTTAEYSGCLSEVYLNFSEFMDFSLLSNRRLFINGAGFPVELGVTGSLPTGTAPIMYFPDGDATTNAGTGGNFAQGGTVAACATVPNTAPALSARDIIEIVRDEIDAAKVAETEDDFLRLRLGFAEDFLTDALSKFDEGDFRKTAKGVKKAVKFLELAVEKGFDAATVDDWGDRLCGSIRTIASDEIDAAILRTGDPVKIAEAQDAFADGELEKLFMEFLDAIRDYEKAIKSATVA